MIFDSFAMSRGEVATEVYENDSYAGELLGVLLQGGLIVEQDGDNGVVFQTANPGTYDTNEREVAEKVIDEFIEANTGNPTSSPRTPRNATSPKGPVTEDGSPCLCGCGEPTGRKSNYRPGHDARHAGQVARQIAERPDQIVDLLAALPTDALKAKAEGQAANLLAKEAKRDKAENQKVVAAAEKVSEDPVSGTLTVGNKEREGRRNPDGSVEFMNDKGDWKAASKTAASTFQEG